MDGILIINKPPGKTSFAIVAMIKRLSGERHVGHSGTLDPSATGVLPVCLGKGTRIIEFMAGDTKSYLAGIELGTATDTYDASGQITQQADPSGINQAKLEDALNAFRGTIRQTPPMYSALKYHGQPLYTLARAGITIEREDRPATIHRLELISFQPPVVTIEVECSKGTYIRSLAHDLGQALGCGAHLKELVRTRCGPFNIEHAISVPHLEEAFRYGYWATYLYPVDTVLLHYGAIIVNSPSEEKIKNGSSLPLEPGIGEDLCRAYATDGRFLGVLRPVAEKGVWQPKKVFSQLTYQ